VVRQTCVFTMRTPPPFTVNYLVDHFFLNLDLSISKFERIVFQLGV